MRLNQNIIEAARSCAKRSDAETRIERVVTAARTAPREQRDDEAAERPEGRARLFILAYCQEIKAAAASCGPDAEVHGRLAEAMLTAL